MILLQEKQEFYLNGYKIIINFKIFKYKYIHNLLSKQHNIKSLNILSKKKHKIIKFIIKKTKNHNS